MPADHDALLTETLARHFPAARVADGEIDLGVGGLRMTCAVHGTQAVGPYHAAHLFFWLRGGSLGDAPVFASASGYEATPEAAILVGACNWACAFGPVLRAGLAGEALPDVDGFDASLHGQPFRVVVDGVDRVIALDRSGTGVERARAGRARLGASPWLTRTVIDSGRLPLLPPDRASLLSVFVSDAAGRRVVEVKVNGCDWPAAADVFASAAPEPEGAVTLLRELAVVVPRGAAPALAREPLARTLEGLALAPPDGEPRGAVRWPGWRAHRGELGPPLAPAELDRLEREVGPLPPDYRAFVADVAGSGAGPGYGLLPPTGEAQRRLAGGTFAWRDGEAPDDSPAGALALAHAGCGVVWLLVLRGERRGEVWLDAAGADGRARRVAGSFAEWYRAWLDAAVRDATPWSQWDAARCATPAALSRVLEDAERRGHRGEAAVAHLTAQLRAGSIALRSGGGPYHDAGAALDPCHACVCLAEQLGAGPEVFAPGVAPRQALAGDGSAPVPPSVEGKIPW